MDDLSTHGRYPDVRAEIEGGDLLFEGDLIPECFVY